MSVRLLKRSFPSLAQTCVRYQSSSVGKSDIPKFYKYHVYSALRASEKAAKSTDRLVVDASTVSLTLEQEKAMRKANEKAQELLKAMQEVRAIIPVDDVEMFQQMFADSLLNPNAGYASSNQGFAKGYATAKMEEAVKNGSFEAFTTSSAPETVVSNTAESVASASAETFSSTTESVGAGAAEAATNVASSMGDGVLEAAGSVLGGIGQLFGSFFE